MIFIGFLRQKTVLIVDDEPSNLKIIGEILSEWDLKIAKNGKDALRIAKKALPDIILLDIMLPDINGYQVCKQLKSISATRNIPIIFITAKNRKEDELYALGLGAIDYITKPFNPTLVKTKVRNHLKYQQTKKRLRKFSKAIEQSPVSIVITDLKGNIEYVNPKFTQMTGYSLEEILGENPQVLKTDYHPDSYYQDLWETITAGQNWEGEFYNQKKNGEYYWERAKITPIFNQVGEIEAFIGIKEDITEEKKLKDKLKFFAQRDELTNTYNRRAGYKILKNMIKNIDNQGGFFSIAFIDINNLKLVNDVYGHDIGDEYIINVVETIKEVTREEDIIARFGGDEFLIIFAEIKDEIAFKILERIQVKLKLINQIEKYNYKMSISYGVEEYNLEKELGLNELISTADSKMYQFKKEYKSKNGLTNRL